MSIRNEVAKAEFGDVRLTKRLGVLVSSLASRAKRSLPKALGSEAKLEAAYRFLNNERVTPERILAPHLAETKTRIAAAQTVVVSHDTTQFRFEGDGREGLGRVHANGQGFYAHVALAMSADGQRLPLGVIGAQTFTRSDEKKPKPHPKARQKQPDRESRRWWSLVEEVESRLDGCAKAIHVMDREADMYELLSEMSSAKYRFVIRSTFDRLLDDKDEKLFSTLAACNSVAEREVPLTPRKKSPFPKQRRIHPARTGRLATLRFSATKVTLRRPDNAPLSLPATLELNAIQVLEVDAPDGQTPVCWRLLTSESIAGEDEILRAVDYYRGRWLIEEYWKALKTGCSIEKRQLESLDALLNLLALCMPIAWQLLLLRNLARSAPQTRIQGVLSPTRLQVLRAVSNGRLKDNPTVGEILEEIAALGGHIKNNGHPGWIVIGRGYEDLLLLEQGFLLASGKM